MHGMKLVLSAGGLWALFCAWLWSAGHAPSRTLVPIPRELYYAAQALFVMPLLIAQWKLATWVGARFGRSSTDALSDGMSQALFAPLLVLLLLPDVVSYAYFGFASLGPLVRVTAPLTFCASLVLATHHVARASGRPYARCVGVAFGALLAQALLGAPLLR
jgi:hypothetical protein